MLSWIQELAYEISITIVPQILAVRLLLLSLLVWLDNLRILKLQRILFSMLILAAIARFCLPISSLANEFLQEHFFEQKIMEVNGKLSRGTADLDTLTGVHLPKYVGIMGAIGNSASYIKNKSLEFKKAIEITIENKGLIVENLLRLTFLYLGVFVIQVLVLPLLIFWFLIRVVNSFFI